MSASHFPHFLVLQLLIAVGPREPDKTGLYTELGEWDLTYYAGGIWVVHVRNLSLVSFCPQPTFSCAVRTSKVETIMKLV